MKYLGFERLLRQTSRHKPIKNSIEMTFKTHRVAIAHNYANAIHEENLMVDTNITSDVITNIKKKTTLFW